jgi:glycogen debranching enzyme
MLHHGPFQDRKHLEQIYPLLSRWTQWYLRYRDSNQDGLPEYRRGNEAGWDNATVFDEGQPHRISGPQRIFVRANEGARGCGGAPGTGGGGARQWKQQSDQLLERMLQRFWQDGEFVAIHATDGRPTRSQSLLLDMPIVLGTRLPASVQAQLIADLRKRASESSFGVGSEPKSSPLYKADGYWPGSIWALWDCAGR